MFNSAMIKYDVNEETKVVVASVEGIAYDAINTMLKTLRRQNIIATESFMVIESDESADIRKSKFTEMHSTVCKKYLLPNELKSEAHYDPQDPNEFSVERGKQIARRRLYAAYNSDYLNILNNIVEAIKSAIDTDIEKARAITEERLINFKYYEYYDILKLNLEESFKQ